MSESTTNRRPLPVTLAAIAALALSLAACAADNQEQPAGNPTQSGASPLLPERIRDSGTLVLATDPNYPPCQYFEDGSDEMIGFEVDLWNAAAAALGITVSVESTTFDGLIPGVQSGRYDVAMECITDNAEREETVTFVNYGVTKGAIFTLAENPAQITTDPRSLCGLRMSAVVGMDQIQTAENILSVRCEKLGEDRVTVQTYPSSAASMLALYSGRADFVITDVAAGVHLAKTAPEPITHFENELVPSFYWGAIVNKEEVELQEALQSGFQAIIDDGSYQEIMAKWGIEELMIDEAGINLATASPLPVPTP